MAVTSDDLKLKVANALEKQLGDPDTCTPQVINAALQFLKMFPPSVEEGDPVPQGTSNIFKRYGVEPKFDRTN